MKNPEERYQQITPTLRNKAVLQALLTAAETILRQAEQVAKKTFAAADCYELARQVSVLRDYRLEGK